MLVKNLSRHGGGHAPVLKYIFKYIFRGTATTKHRGRRAYSREDDKQTTWERVGYVRALRNAEVRFNQKDIDYLLREKMDWTLTRDLLQKVHSADNVKYVEEYLMNTAKGNENAPFIMTHNIRPYKDINDIIRQFEQNEAGRISRNKNSPTVHHTIISFSSIADSEKVTDDMLRAMAQEYISLRGQDLLFAISLHQDTAHKHLHICQSASTTDGRTSRISKAEFAEIKDRLQEFQKRMYPFLEHSLPDHGKKKRAIEKGEWDKIKSDERCNVKTRLLETISSIRPKGTKELLEQLEAEGYFPYYRASKLTGVLHVESNLKFRFNRLGLDIEGLQKIEERTIKEETLLAQIAGIRNGERNRELEDRFGSIERESKDEEKDKDVLKDIADIRAGREVDDDREREYEADDSTDDSTSDADYSSDSEDDSDNEPEEVEEQELEDEEEDDDSEDIV